MSLMQIAQLAAAAAGLSSVTLMEFARRRRHGDALSLAVLAAGAMLACLLMPVVTKI